MSEKRFTFDTEQRSVGEIQVIIDNKEKKVYANCFSICEKLNEQQSIIDEQKIAIDEMITDYKNLEKENEKLRKELGDCEKFRYTVFKRLNEEHIKEHSIK